MSNLITTNPHDTANELRNDEPYDIYSTFIVFGNADTWLRRLILRLGIMWYSATWQLPTWTHCYIVELNHTRRNAIFYELTYDAGMRMDVVEYIEALVTHSYDRSTNTEDSTQLTITVPTFYGGTESHIYEVLDVTKRVHDEDIDVEGNWVEYYTDNVVSLSTYLKVLRGQPSHTWTCSGLTQALMDWDSIVSYHAPRTPDDLYQFYKNTTTTISTPANAE